MVAGVKDLWLKENLPMNQPGDIGRIMVEIALGKVEGERYNGKAVFCEGGRGWDVEGVIAGLQDVWMGEETSRMLNRGQAVLGDGTDWVKDD